MPSAARPEALPAPGDAAPAATGTAAGPAAPLPGLALAALLSGVTALVAQTVWIRGLGRAVGTTTEALAAVMAVFLGGLGLGALLGGRRAAGPGSPGRSAGRCLLAAALCVMVSPWLFDALPAAHLAVLGLLGQEPGPSPWPALIVGLPLLLVPTLFMGASFPLLVRARAADPAHVGRGTGALYAWNTLGAALGVLVSALALAQLGERLTLSLAAALQVLAAAILLVRSPAAQPAGAPAGAATAGPVERGAPRRPLVVLALTGLCGLGLEVAAFRLLEPLTGPHLWGVTLLLVPVLLGIALGGALGGRAADRAADPERALATAVTWAGLLGAASVFTAGLLPRLLLVSGAEGLARVGLLALGATLVLLPALTALGAAYPLAVRAAATGGRSAARAAGDLSWWNAVGSTAGSLLTGFVVLPLWGAPRTLLYLGGLLLAVAALLRLTGRGPRRAATALATALPLALLALPASREALRASAPSLPEVVAVGRVSARVPREDPAAPPQTLALRTRDDARLFAHWFGGRPARLPAARGGAVVEPRDGRMGTVALLEEPGGVVRLRVNGLSEARFGAEAPEVGSPTETALGLLPCLVHPAPRRALVIGHGAGWTAEAVLATDVTQVDVAELDATVLASVERWRGHPLAAAGDPRARLVLTDGRLLLRRAAQRGGDARYDVIASQPSHPWVPGAGHLFTREAYTLAREALADGGVFAQWINLFEMSPELLQAALATFRDVFPETWLFLFPREVVLLGFAGRPALDAARWERLLTADARVQAVAGPAGFRAPGDLWRHFTLDGAGVDAFAPSSSTARVEDDRPLLELGLAWRVLTQAAGEDLDEALRRHFPPDLERALPERTVRERWATQAIDGWLAVGAPGLAALWSEKVRWGSDPRTQVVRAALARAQRDMPLAEQLLRAAAAEPGAPSEWVAGWMYVLAEGAAREASLRERFPTDARPLAEARPDDGVVRAAYARLLEQAGRPREAIEAYRTALKASAPRAPAGTAAALARLLLVAEPEPGADTLPSTPDLGGEAYVLGLLRDDPSRREDRDTLELWGRLETRHGDPLRASEAEELLRALDARDGERSLREAWSRLTSLDGEAVLPYAEQAALLAPGRAEVWEAVALARLLLAARAGAGEAAAEHERRARFALGRAWHVGGEAALGRARAYLRWFGVDDAGLVREAGE